MSFIDNWRPLSYTLLRQMEIRKDSDGFTLDADGREFMRDTGYIVGVTPNGAVCETFADLLAALHPAKTFIGSNVLYGFWRDAETGKGYYDICEWVANKQDALNLAAQFNQISVWDCGAKEAIYV